MTITHGDPHPHRTPQNRVYLRTLHLWGSPAGAGPLAPMMSVAGVSADDDEDLLPGVRFLGLTTCYGTQLFGTLVALLRVPADVVSVNAAEQRVLVHHRDVLVPASPPGPGPEPGAVRWFDQHGVQQFGPAESLYADVDLFIADLKVHAAERPVVDRGLSFPK
jgi:hypothetical protein